MEESMRDCLRKLALWHTRTFRPITTHDELDPIMSTLGFVGLPPSTPSSSSTAAWKEYAYSAQWRRRTASAADHQASPPPRPRLPYPRIDGLHSYTYQAFLDAVDFYLEMADVSLLFHIRGMPLHRVDMYKKWKRMQEDESVFVYREGTLDQSTYNIYHRPENGKQQQQQQQQEGSGLSSNGSLILRRDKGASISTVPPPDCVVRVPLKDIIVS